MKKRPITTPSATQMFYQQYIKPGLQESFFQEWGRQIEQSIKANKIDATIFANFFLELMRDPHNDACRRACAGLSNIMRTSSWAEIAKMMASHLDSATANTFQKPAATEFYEQLKAMVLAQIRDYWEQFMASHMKKSKKKKKK